MKMLKHDAQELSPEEIEHLEKLKSVVEKALENGKFSNAQMERINSIIWADGKVTYDELHTINETIKSVMGDLKPELEWEPYS